MNLQRAKFGIGVVALGLGMAVVPVAPAWAGLHKASTHHGSHTGGSFCQLEKSVQQAQNSKGAVAATNALVAGNWKLAQKDLLAIDQHTATLEKDFLSALFTAPHNVKAAAGVLISFVPLQIKAIKDSNSAKQFVALETAAATPKYLGAAKVIGDYEVAQCGSPTSSS